MIPYKLLKENTFGLYLHVYDWGKKKEHGKEKEHTGKEHNSNQHSCLLVPQVRFLYLRSSSS